MHKQNIENKYINFINILLIIYAFFIPISQAAGNILLGLMLITWLIAPDWKNKIKTLKSNKVILCLLLFWFFQLIGIIWSVDRSNGFKVFWKFRYVMLFPVVMDMIQPKNNIKYLISYIYGVSVTVLLSFGIYFNIYKGFVEIETKYTPFAHHAQHATMIAIAIIFIIQNFILKSASLKSKILSIIAVILFTVNLYITGGRTGQICFIALIFVLFVANSKRKILSFISAMIFAAIFITTGFYFVPEFKTGIDAAIYDINQYPKNSNTSLGLRFNIIEGAIPNIKKSPVFGNGTGSFKSLHHKFLEEKYPQNTKLDIAHNTYLHVLLENGITGLLIFLYIWAALIITSIKNKDEYQYLRFSIIIVFLLSMINGDVMIVGFLRGVFFFFTSLLFNRNLISEY
ncbi:MAG: O-antigen ligase family protein [Candidatus Muiribacteriota bacterium]